MKYRDLAILIGLVCLSAALSSGFALILPPLPAIFYIFFSLALFLLLFILFDRYLWRWFKLNNQPDIHGDWVGRLITSNSENSHIEGIKLHVVQRWLTTRVDFVGQYSSSSNYATVFLRDETGQATLAYIYYSEPYKGAEEIVPAHFGLAVLRLIEAGRLSGFYHHMRMTDAGAEFTYGQLVWWRPETKAAN